MRIKKKKMIITRVAIIIIITSLLCTSVSAYPAQASVNNGSSYGLVKVNQAGVNSLKYYAKKIKEAEAEIIAINRQLMRTKEGTEKYINLLVRQSTLRHRLISLHEKVLKILRSEKVTIKEYYSVFPK